MNHLSYKSFRLGVEVISDTLDHRGRKLDRHEVAAVVTDQVMDVFLLDEPPGAAHRHLIHQVEQVLGRQRVGVHLLGSTDVIRNAGNADGCELGVVAHEIGDQGLKIA